MTVGDFEYVEELVDAGVFDVARVDVFVFACWC